MPSTQTLKLPQTTARGRFLKCEGSIEATNLAQLLPGAEFARRKGRGLRKRPVANSVRELQQV